jgi:hypothetical protein
MASETLRAVALATTLLASICATAMAQTSAPAAGASESHLVKPAELEQLVAPIALFSDPLLAEVRAGCGNLHRPISGVSA